ncbi:hypothetical protein [Salmonella phage SD-1_S14]|nr:hypothetical protein [Salmonella phage SD-2_S15]WPK18940.1 hypothetical protein [Salmonella phage SD-6_S16]WPK19612.1 hypothetical protein [Salmonella phage SD-1_S14]WPK20634.1 hypothetical protein [Salmonella phage SD-15_S21]
MCCDSFHILFPFLNISMKYICFLHQMHHELVDKTSVV